LAIIINLLFLAKLTFFSFSFLCRSYKWHIGLQLYAMRKNWLALALVAINPAQNCRCAKQKVCRLRVSAYLQHLSPPLTGSAERLYEKYL